MIDTTTAPKKMITKKKIMYLHSTEGLLLTSDDGLKKDGVEYFNDANIMEGIELTFISSNKIIFKGKEVEEVLYKVHDGGEDAEFSLEILDRLLKEGALGVL